MRDTDSKVWQPPLLTLLAGLSLAMPALIGLLTGPETGPTIAFPWPALVLIPVFVFRQGALAVPTVLFFVWNPELFRGDNQIPGRSFVLLIVATVMSVGWFAIGWRDGLAVEGVKYNYAVCGINVLWIGVLWVMFARNRNDESTFGTNLLLHWLLFAWLGWYGFPFFGEMI